MSGKDRKDRLTEESDNINLHLDANMKDIMSLRIIPVILNIISITVVPLPHFNVVFRSANQFNQNNENLTLKTIYQKHL